MESRILHVIEAAGWRADFVREGGGDAADTIRVPLICFALIEEFGRFSPTRRVVGMCSSGADIVAVAGHELPGYRLAGYSHRDSEAQEVRLPEAIGSPEEHDIGRS